MNTSEQFSPVAEPWVWTADELAKRDEWIVNLDAQALADIATALDNVKQRNLAIDKITRADFPLPSISAGLATVKQQLTSGLGLCLVRGLPVDRYNQDDLSLILWGIGTHIGTGVSQSYRGDMIGEVMDMTHTGDARRAYRSPRPLDLHVDLVDVVGLLCMRKAKSGGASLVASSFAVHNAILAERPDLIPPLYRGYYYRHSEASSTGEPPTSPHPVPVFGRVGQSLACTFNSSPITRSFDNDDIEYGPAAMEAFEFFRQTAAREDLLYRMMLEPGDLQFINNRKTLHGREEFHDVDELERKRLMLRVWLTMPTWPIVPDHLRVRKSAGHTPMKVGAIS